ncbi:MAG: ThuA domain-containing protein [Gammaproteobacteria bacterium]|nr:ThuA domain-containing protein [Gammaproteobacteria bacterium]
MDKLDVLIVSKGHFYNHDSFLAMFDSMADIETTLVEHPAAQVILRPEHVARYDAVLFYDMSGIPGAGLTHDLASEDGQPSADYRASIEALIELGKGIVLLNHASVSWPEWPLWRAITGTSFMLKAGQLDGRQVPGSGYRGGHGPHPNATFRVSPELGHAVLEGLDAGFEVTDELYLKTAEFESRVLPLMRADYDFVVENFSPPPLAPEAEQSSWSHPPGSNLVVWANAAAASPVVVSELGDGPAAFDNPGYRRLLHNALRWTASAEARAWAAKRRG